MLLDCLTWIEPRNELLGDLRTKDLRFLLNDRKGAKAAIKLILHTDILAQFRPIARQELAKRTNQHQRPENMTNAISEWEEHMLSENSELDNSQFDSDDASISQADHTQTAGFESP